MDHPEEASAGEAVRISYSKLCTRGSTQRRISIVPASTLAYDSVLIDGFIFYFSGLHLQYVREPQKRLGSRLYFPNRGALHGHIYSMSVLSNAL